MQHFSKNFMNSGNPVQPFHSLPTTPESGLRDDFGAASGMETYQSAHSGSPLLPDMPEVVDWMYEHHFMANLFKAITLTKEVLVSQGDLDNGEFHVTPDGEWILTTKAKEILKAHCHEVHWQYVENFLLA